VRELQGEVVAAAGDAERASGCCRARARPRDAASRATASSCTTAERCAAKRDARRAR